MIVKEHPSNKFFYFHKMYKCPRADNFSWLLSKSKKF